MAAYFNASESGYSWMASSYLLANASCIPLWGKLSDIWGRKYIILIANFAFLVGSLICALSVNLAMMLVGRAIQGIGGGGIVVLTNISVSDLFSVRFVTSRGLPDIGGVTDVAGIAPCTTVYLVLFGPLPVLWARLSEALLPPV